ncbi:MAG TPA: hypothetical protein VJO16_03625 [Candidatus Acidoferrum sp.]|nr:hypothetical protein [Candidatus Acidoferrum sp.]
MGRLFPRLLSVTLAFLLPLIPSLDASQQKQKPDKKEKPLKKQVLNFDGGIVFATEGSLSELTCFRLDGRVTAPGFFDDFKRIDDENGTEYRSGKEIATEFPEELHVGFVMFDIPCKSQMAQPGPRKYMTGEMMKSLRFSFYWKRGIELRHIENLKPPAAAAEPIEPFNTESKEELPKKYRWILEFDIPSAGVPLTDRLVLIIRTPDGRRAARVAARL